MKDVLDRHERIALQLSGGRDSIACLYLAKPYWDRLTVYWLDPGAAFPETVSLMRDIKNMVPRFERVEGRQPNVVKTFGMPTDILPARSTPYGVASAWVSVPMQDRYSCCLRSIMLPMQERMVADGITLIIRGQRESDRQKSIVRSGEIHDGIEYLFPIEAWDTRQVMNYLMAEGAPIPRFYEMLEWTPDCIDCTAWWEEGTGKYLKRYHHQQFVEYQNRLDIIRQEVSENIAAFNQEVNHGL